MTASFRDEARSFRARRGGDTKSWDLDCRSCRDREEGLAQANFRSICRLQLDTSPYLASRDLPKEDNDSLLELALGSSGQNLPHG